MSDHIREEEAARRALAEQLRATDAGLFGAPSQTRAPAAPARAASAPTPAAPATSARASLGSLVMAQVDADRRAREVADLARAEEARQQADPFAMVRRRLNALGVRVSAEEAAAIRMAIREAETDDPSVLNDVNEWLTTIEQSF